VFQKSFAQDSYTTKGHCKPFKIEVHDNKKSQPKRRQQSWWTMELFNSMHMSCKNKSHKNLEPSYSFSSQMNWILKLAKTFNMQNAFKIEKTFILFRTTSQLWRCSIQYKKNQQGEENTVCEEFLDIGLCGTKKPH